MKIYDCHIHYAQPIEPEQIVEVIDESKTDFFNLVLVPERKLVSSICDAMVVKAKYLNRCTVFSSLDVSKYFINRKNLGEAFKKYTIFLKKMGADGIKLIEGKPTMRKILPVPNFDDMVWEPFFDYCEKTQTPILWHVNDPEEFWDKNSIPPWAKSQGWYYDETYVKSEEQYAQVLNMLKRHPNIKIVFAHFFFMSKQLNRLQEILDKYPNIYVDLTPGIEMYINFSNNIKDAKEFFIKNQDRIIYGTDIGARAVLSDVKTIDKKECLDRAVIVRGFLENKMVDVKADGNFLVGIEDFSLNGLSLDDKILEKIYYTNFKGVIKNIAPINKKLVIKEAIRLKKTITIMSLFDKKVTRNFTYLNKAINYFKGKGGN